MIGSDFGMHFCSSDSCNADGPEDPSFTEWLFQAAAKGATEVEEPSQPEPSTSELPPRDAPPHVPVDAPRRIPNPPPPRSGVYQQALSQALPATTSAQKRSASARSPSPSHPNKARRTDLPTGPRAMLREGSGAVPHNSRSLLDRVGGPAGPRNGGQSNGLPQDDVQSRIDNIVNNSPDQNMMMAAGFPAMGGVGGMDMSGMANMANPMMFQDILMNQMALMAQMTTMMNGGPGFVQPGFAMPGMPGDMGMFQGGTNTGFQGGQMGGNGNTNGGGRGRGSGRGGRGGPNRGRGGAATSSKSSDAAPSKDSTGSQSIPISAPSPITPAQSTLVTPLEPSITTQRLGYALPERPQSPTLCKFSTKCTNSQCRYAHPSPVATAESGVVLSNEACEKGKNCQDKDCIKAHVSPAVLSPQGLCDRRYLAIQYSIVSFDSCRTCTTRRCHSPIPRTQLICPMPVWCRM